MRFYHATNSENAKRIIRDGLKVKNAQIARSPETAISQAMGSSRKSDLVVLELRGLSNQSLKAKTEKQRWIEGEVGRLTKPVPADKIRIYSGLGYSGVIDLSGPTTRRTWIDVGNKPKEK